MLVFICTYIYDACIYHAILFSRSWMITWQVWSAKSQIIKIPLDLPGLEMAAGRVNFPHNCYSLDITASEAVRRKKVFFSFSSKGASEFASTWMMDPTMIFATRGSPRSQKWSNVPELHFFCHMGRFQSWVLTVNFFPDNHTEEILRESFQRAVKQFPRDYLRLFGVI